MALPKIDVPVFQLTIPSTQQNVKYRPFLVKEEKILLMAMEGNDPGEMALGIKQIVNNCVQDTIDVDKLSPFDLEFFFVNLRAKSVGEGIQLSRKCISMNKDKKVCGANIEFEVDTNDIKVVTPEGHTNNLKLTDTVGVMMNYPDISLAASSGDDPNADMILDTVLNCMESIYDEEEVYKIKDTPTEEVVDFLESLTQEQFAKIRKFFDTMPKVTYQEKIQCPKCKKKEDVIIEGMQSFFG